MVAVRSLAWVSVLLGACAGQLNPSVPTPKPGALGQQPGVWVAYNLGCAQGCDQIHCGDIITAVDGKPVTSGAEIDAVDLARGTPVRVDVRSRAHGPRSVTLLATPNEQLGETLRAPPLWTVGTGALDRAPAWARLPAFGHATPAMRLYHLDDPRGFRDGRDLLGRHTLIVFWTPYNNTLQDVRRNIDQLPGVYAQLQAHEPELRAAGVDPIFLVSARIDPKQRAYIRQFTAIDSYGWAPHMVPIYSNATVPSNGNTRGVEHPAADLNEMVFRDGHVGPILLVIDARGIVRWHSRGWHDDDAEQSIEAVVDFAVHDLEDAPATSVASR